MRPESQDESGCPSADRSQSGLGLFFSASLRRGSLCLELLPVRERDAKPLELGLHFRIGHEASVAVAKRGRAGDTRSARNFSIPAVDDDFVDALGEVSRTPWDSDFYGPRALPLDTYINNVRSARGDDGDKAHSSSCSPRPRTRHGILVLAGEGRFLAHEHDGQALAQFPD